MHPAEVARRAAEIIASRGLAKHALEDARGRVCHDGAIRTALGASCISVTADGLPEKMRDDQFRLYCSVQNATRTILHSQGFYGAGWLYNDEPGTTAEDVILCLKRAAELLEEADD